MVHKESGGQNGLTNNLVTTAHLLFNPLRTHADALADAIVRDLSCVFVDPFEPQASPPVSPRKVEKTGLPTPQESPNPKKGGMSEEQVKYARDLSTVTNAAIKFLAIAFSVPAIYNVFSSTCRTQTTNSSH